MTTVNPNPPNVENHLEIDHEGSLEDIFQVLIQKAKKTLIEKGGLTPAVFLIFRDHKLDQFKLALYPIINLQPGQMQWHANMIKGIIRNIRQKENKNELELIGTVYGLDSHLSMYKKEDVLDNDGNLNIKNNPNYVRPSENKDSKDALCFQLEDENVRHTIYYEYIKSDLGDVVINPKPMLDAYSKYNKSEDINSNMGFLFVKPTE